MSGGAIDLSNATRNELMYLLRNRNVKNITRLNKAQLIAYLQDDPLPAKVTVDTTWTQALEQFNDLLREKHPNHRFLIPAKGTEEYKQVKKLQERFIEQENKRKAESNATKLRIMSKKK